MTDAARSWSLSNPGPDEMLLWLEPWAEEFVIPIGSTITLESLGGSEKDAPGEVEWTPEHLVVWATAQRVQVYIDGERQESGSATISIPDGLTKGMLNILFADYPAARLGGTSVGEAAQTSWWRKLRHRFGL